MCQSNLLCAFFILFYFIECSFNPVIYAVLFTDIFHSIAYTKEYCHTFQDMVIEVIYAEIITGKLDQVNQQIEVDYAIGRDIRPEAVKEIVDVLSQWWVHLSMGSCLIFKKKNYWPRCFSEAGT